MRNVCRNERQMWYATYDGLTDVLDANGDIAGQRESYSEPVEFWAVLSPSKGVAGFGGTSYPSFYGVNVDCDRRIMTAELDLPIDETTLIWLDEPETYQDGTANPQSATFTVIAKPADGLNFVSIPVTYRTKDETD